MGDFEQREAVIAEARSWIDTPFVHQAECKGAGVDCAHIINAVYSTCGLMPWYQFPVYGKDWFRHAENEEKYIVEIAKLYFDEIRESECLPGDWLVVRLGRAYAHCAIITEVRNNLPSKGINAWPTHEKVWEVDLQQDRIFSGRLKRYFRPRWRK